MLYALRGAKRQNKLCAAELLNNRKFTTVKDIFTTKPKNNYNVSENDNNFQLELSDFPGEQDSDILVRERARGTKLDGLYKKKKGVITKETDHTITVSGKKRRPTIYSKRDIVKAITNEAHTASNQEATTSQPTANAQRERQTPSNDSEPIKKPQPAKVNEKKKKSKLPKEFHRLQNWQQLLETDSTDEEEERRRQKAPIKATINWEKQPKEEPKSEEETASQQSSDRPRRERKTPNYFGNPVMICGVEQEKQNPDVIIISSSTDEN